ncbi:MAG: LuxR C-terminal-related transcriptional regulator [Sulfuricellaceae bacterium]|nr:LuxR C-terminal-related transcriptional regulator [Sulfuricellaceae bacterium]
MGGRKTQQTNLEHEAGLLDLVGDIYQAGLEPERWPQVIKRLSQAFDADLACIYTPIVTRPEQALYLTYNFAESTQADYSAYYHRLDAWTQSALQRDIYIQGLVAFGEQLIAPADLRRTEFYRDFLKPNGMEWIITTALFDGRTHPNTPATHMTFTRHDDHAAFEADKAGLIELIAPHVRRALLTHWQLTEARLHQRIHQAGMDSLGYGVALLGVNGKAIYLNAFAEQILQAADGLMLKANQLMARNAPEHAALLNLLQQAANGLGGGLHLKRDNGHGATKRPYSLTAIPLQEGHPFRPLADARVMLLIHDPEYAGPLDSLKTYATRYRLTPAEARVLTLLLSDLGPQQIADHLGVGIRTVRSQLSSLYTKTGTKNQRDLIVSALGFGIAVTNGNAAGQ